MALIYNENHGQWEEINIASETRIQDLSESYDSDDVEGALQEIVAWDANRQKDITEIQSTLATHSEDIEYLKEHGGGGGGGGGTTLPTITTTSDSEIVIDSGSILELPIFFASPNLGDGLAYILFDNVEMDTVTIKQGSNTISIDNISSLKTQVSIYVKDRGGLISNILSWTVICGGIELELDFDYNADYMITDEIYMPYYITSATDSKVYLNLTIDGETITQECEQGYNSYQFEELGVGIHVVTLYATDGTYSSQKYEFNLVVLDSEGLYVSTTFKESEFDYGIPIQINYRISDSTKRKFNVKLYLDSTLNKTLTSSRGSYYWTLTDVEIGDHTFKVEVSYENELKTIEGRFTVVEGDYTPVSINTQGLIYRMDPTTKTNQDSDRDCFEYNGITTNLYGFNFSSNGWVDGELVCNGGSYAVIDYSPLADNVKSGITIEVYFKSTDIGKDEALVIDCSDKDTNKGFSIGLEQCSIRSISNTATSFVNPDEYIKVSFVIDRRNKFAKVFLNGVCSRSFALTDTGSGVNTIYEDFVHDGKIYINCDSLVENIGCCNIKDVLIYKRALSDEELLKNTIAFITDLPVQKVNYNFEFNNTTVSQIRMYGDDSNMTLENAVQMRIKYMSANTDKYGQSFDLPYCLVCWQGTSSKAYVKKNYQVRLRDSNMEPYYYTPFPNGIPEWIFCFKADYMESSHSRNVGIARLLNDCLYSTKNPAQLKDSRVRNTIDGFPCILYINDELVGIYNFNTDRYSNLSFGYTDEDNTLVYEIAANSDTTAGAFFKWTSDSGKTEINYYKNDFTCLYPPTRAAGNDSFNEIKRLVEWVDNASDEEFKDNIGLYFNKEYLIRYFIYVYIFGAVDSLGKNMKLASWDGGKIWYIQPYDCDTTIGLDNSGFMKFECNIEVGEENTFNTTTSRLWEKVQRVFADDIRSEYALLRRTTLTNENIFKYIIDDQIKKIPKLYYNYDMQSKYLDFGSSYLYALHGDGETFIRQWLTDRLLYTDTYFQYDVTTADFITLRASKLGDVFLDIQTFKHMYFTIIWENTSDGSGTDRIRVNKNEVKRFTHNMKTSTDQEVIIYGGKYIKSLGDLSNLEPTTISIANAPKITELVCHSSKLVNTDASNCVNLNRVDISDCSILGKGTITGVSAQPILDVSACKNIEYINCQNTKITEVKIDEKGSNIKELNLPKAIEVITLNNCPNLTNINMESGHACKRIRLEECPNVKFGTGTTAYLSGVMELDFTNSCDSITELCIEDSTKLQKITLYDCDSITKIRLGLGVIFKNMPEYTKENAQSGNSITISAKRCNNLKDFVVTGYGRKSSSDFTKPVRDNTDSSSNNQYNSFIRNVIDISDTLIENVEFLCTSIISELLVPITFKNLRCNSSYDTSNSIWGGLEGTYGSTIFNIYNPKDGYTHDSDNNIWNFDGLDLVDFDISNMDTSNLVRMENLNASPVKYPISFNMHHQSISPTGTVDYTNYKGKTLYYAFSNSDSGLTIILPDVFETVEDFTKAFYRCKQSWNWTDAINMVNNAPNLKTIGDEAFAYASLTNDAAVSFTNGNEITIGSNLFNSCNLERITEFNMPNSNYLYTDYDLFGVFSNSNLISIGNISLNKARFKCLFYNSQSLQSIGDININSLTETSGEYMCFQCPKLTSIGSFDSSEITNFGSSFRGTQIRSVNIDVSKAKSIEYACYNCTSLETATLNNLDTNTTLTSSASCFYRCLNLRTVVGASTLPSTITDCRFMYRSCSSLTSAPTLPSTLNASLNAIHMCRDSAIKDIGNLPEKLAQADFMFSGVAVTNANINLPSTLISAENMLDAAAATEINITIPSATTDAYGLLTNSTATTINFNIEDPMSQRNMKDIIGNNNPNLKTVTGLNLYKASFSEYLNCPALESITFTDNSEITDSLNVSSSPLLEVSTIEKIIDILWDATGWEEYEEVENEDGTISNVLKVKRLTLGKVNLSKLSEEYVAKAVNKNWTVS